MSLSQFLQAIIAVSGSNVLPIKVDGAFIEQNHIKLWEEFPLLVPKSVQGILRIDDNKAVEYSLAYRPTSATISDTLAWLASESPKFKIEAGMDSDRERDLIKKRLNEQEWQ